MKINSAVLDAEILLSWILKKPKEFIYAHPEKIINSQQLTKFRKLINQCAKGMPIAYLTGHKEFYGLNFLVNKDTLIPRPETELMVEEVLKQIKNDKIKNFTLIDVGTGSGCIPICLVKIFYSVIPAQAGIQEDLRIIGLDISKKVLLIACRNAKLHKVNNKIKFIKSNLLKNILCIVGAIHELPLQGNNTHLIITANLPYLSKKIYRQNYNNLKYEPKSALIAGKDGLKYYCQLLKQIQSRITYYSLPITLFLEIDPSQKNQMRFLIKKHLPIAKIEFKKDLAGLNRLIVIKLNQKH
ncbi:peptide chain release factor N(5)-glutamine methyltransferase [Candidatus Kuenenbacteria bacterium CG10_big_fil_rev_8_21_14_0_10_36_11]|uniref:Peptide chain release factor N(5)-glutamine methyltransferase n=1 Tax=Candidatus Kuenenbacteria bacterium CG10_big_fil_rev_8_21_14_0_10_36_11 TaxID=1974618 RepID=A0A2M6WB67_9BACT|nr:MAG: peptide chain release factor N(5)-glutamine methyltransferase [Candidatus Kuenenbacteria bacterium CG10_big_fil_rev_8_21_14_0_10_36_11]